ncbi:unnamed protein product [Rotaria sordida]|uniref:B box-type domain-containing protein n=1 Tax=Rotaria sordida TaxID=392033 RepID=A0A813WPF0_9BILA|nr:unnamed protein product [Rotaria sordida]
MASSNRCSICGKRAGTCFCPGCKTHFCDDDFQSHRGILLNELDGLTIDRNDLQAKLNEAASNKQPSEHLLAQIDEWQRTTIEKVKQAAELARQQVFKIANSKREEITRQFQTLSQELKELRDTKGVVEQDLIRLKQEIHQLNEDLKQVAQSSTIELSMEQSDKIVWQHMIYVEEKSVSAGNQLRQSKPAGVIGLSDESRFFVF